MRSRSDSSRIVINADGRDVQNDEEACRADRGGGHDVGITIRVCSNFPFNFPHILTICTSNNTKAEVVKILKSEKRILRDMLLSRLQVTFSSLPGCMDEIKRGINYLIDMDVISQDSIDSGYLCYVSG